MTQLKQLKDLLEKIHDKVENEKDFISSSEPILRKIQKGLIFPSITEENFLSVRSEILLESVFDPIQNTRSEDLFDENEIMKPEAKEQIMTILNEWRSHLDFKFEIVHLRLIGSMSGFQFNNTADVDINLVVELEDPKNQIWSLRKTLPNGNFLEGTSHPINFWVGTADDPQATSTDRFENIYDLLTDTWEKKTGKSDIKVPYSYVMELAKFFMDGFDLSLSENDRDIMEAEVYMSYDSSKQDLSEKEKRDHLSGKLNEIRANIDRLKIGKHILRSFMVEGYEDMPFRVSIEYENEDPRYSMNSMVYKAIERLEYVEKIKSSIDKGKKMIESVENYLSTEMEME